MDTRLRERFCRRATRGCWFRRIVKDRGAPDLPLFGYTFACFVGDRLHVAAAKTDESDDWQPRSFAKGELEAADRAASRRESDNRVLRQVALCSREYGCFTAQNVFLERGEAALPVSPKCNARCLGCISQLEPPGDACRRRRRASAYEVDGRGTRARRRRAP